MDIDSLGDTWISYGVIVKLPLKETTHIKEYLKEKGVFVYDKVSLGRLILREETPQPSGNNEGVDIEK